MSSVMCRGLQSCLEPRLIEPRVLRHKSKICQPLPWPQRSNFSGEHQHEENCRNEKKADEDNDNNNGCKDINLENNNNGDTGGWNFIQAITNPSNNTKEVTDQIEKVYVHPLVKRSASALSSKSLEMCTESLGSETGTDISESSDEFSSLSWENEKMQLPNEFSSLSWEGKKIQQSKYREFTKKLNPTRSFPPPLISISGSDGVQVRPHRDGGRLIIKAVTVSSCHTYFQADRTNGRLRLSLLKECSVNCDHELVKNNQEALYSEEDGEEVLEHENDVDHELTGEEEELDDDDGCWVEEMEGNGENVGCEIGTGELPRPSRCKEGGSGSKGMSSWGPFCVAIS